MFALFSKEGQGDSPLHLTSPSLLEQTQLTAFKTVEVAML